MAFADADDVVLQVIAYHSWFEVSDGRMEQEDGKSDPTLTFVS